MDKSIPQSHQLVVCVRKRHRLEPIAPTRHPRAADGRWGVHAHWRAYHRCFREGSATCRRPPHSPPQAEEISGCGSSKSRFCLEMDPIMTDLGLPISLLLLFTLQTKTNILPRLIAYLFRRPTYGTPSSEGAPPNTWPGVQPLGTRGGENQRKTVKMSFLTGFS